MFTHVNALGGVTRLPGVRSVVQKTGPPISYVSNMAAHGYGCGEFFCRHQLTNIVHVEPSKVDIYSQFDNDFEETFGGGNDNLSEISAENVTEALIDGASLRCQEHS